MLIAFAIAGNILAAVVSIPLLTMFTGQKITDIAAVITNPDYYRQFQLIQSISAILGFGIPTIITASRLSNRPFLLTGFINTINRKQLGLLVLIIIAGFFISSSLGYVSYQIPLPQNIKLLFDSWEDKYSSMALNLINLNSTGELIISIIVLAFIPAVCEEIFFRGGLQNYIYKSSGRMWFSIIMVSIIFSIVHISGYGFLSRMALGIILGLLYYYSGNIWTNILFHFANNAVAIISLYQAKISGKAINDLVNDKEGSYWGLLAIPVIIYLFIQFQQASKKNIVDNGI